ncbi:MAG: hypothetical protein NPIRA03_41860 [Nitrospirales bacterium]|nr:MAG: hypothetical protein NPIRA03_41860 [Nitrospirales bacterium]
MIEIHKSENILDDQFFNFDYSKQFLSEREIVGLQEIKGVSFYVKGETSFLEFDVFLKQLFKILLSKYKIYLILSENYPDSINRLRSYKKLLYKREEKIGKENLHQTEVEIGNKKSILTSIIKVDENNLDYCVQNLIDSLFRFGLIVKKGKRSFRESKEEYLQEIIKEKANINNRLELNLLKVAESNKSSNSFIIRIQSDGRDNISIEIYGSKKEVDELTMKIREEMELKFYLREAERNGH